MTFSGLFQIIDLFFFVYLLYISVYNLILAVAGLQKREIKWSRNENDLCKFLVLIPCYKDHNVILNSAKKALEQNYPKSLFDVVVIADTLPNDTIGLLRQMPLTVIEVSFLQSTKVRALNRALDQFDNYTALVILDADNVMEPDFLSKFSAQFQKGQQVIQGQRLPKNSDTEIAFLDGLSEKINNHIFRKGTCNLGLSSSIAGSGFGGDFKLLKYTLGKMDSIGGFDKELEILLLEQGVKTKYYQNLVVFDEKVERIEVFENQRKRWVSSQYFYLNRYFRKGMVALFKGNLSYFNSTILRNLQLPRLLNLGLLPLFLIYIYFLSPALIIPIELWWLLSIGYCLSFVLAIPRDLYSYKGMKAIIKLPAVFLIMFKLLFKMKEANRKFIHTPKGLRN